MTRQKITISYKKRFFLGDKSQELQIKTRAIEIAHGLAVVTEVFEIDGREPATDADLQVVVAEAGEIKALSCCEIHPNGTP